MALIAHTTTRRTLTPPRPEAVPSAAVKAPAAKSTKASPAQPTSISDVNEIAKVQASSSRGSKGKILVLLPADGNDPGETALPYAAFKRAGYDVVFATASGKACKTDTLSFRSPFLKATRPDAEGKAAYREMINAPGYKNPITFAQALKRDDFAALYVPGGEGPGMLPFLDDKQGHAIVRKFYERDLPAAFLCHGGLMAARTKNLQTGKSVIHGEKVTTLPKLAEKLGVAAFMASGRPRVYGAFGGNWAADEMAKAAGKGNFVQPDFGLRFRDEDDRRNVVQSGNQIFGGGPWDAKPFAAAFVEMLDRQMADAER